MNYHRFPSQPQWESLSFLLGSHPLAKRVTIYYSEKCESPETRGSPQKMFFLYLLTSTIRDFDFSFQNNYNKGYEVYVLF